jgi:hypothetical protein
LAVDTGYADGHRQRHCTVGVTAHAGSAVKLNICRKDFGNSPLYLFIATTLLETKATVVSNKTQTSSCRPANSQKATLLSN